MKLLFGIEPMHKDWKSNAFEIEKSKITDPKRIETMLILIAFAYVLWVKFHIEVGHFYV
jgi:hypothetical protein